MKLKCNHDRRAMVLPSGHTIHRSDGGRCFGGGSRPSLTIGGKTVVKMFTKNDVPGIPEGTLVLAIDSTDVS